MEWALLALVIMAAPIVFAIWVLVRLVEDRRRIEGLTQMVRALSKELSQLRGDRPAGPRPYPQAAPEPPTHEEAKPVPPVRPAPLGEPEPEVREAAPETQPVALPPKLPRPEWLADPQKLSAEPLRVPPPLPVRAVTQIPVPQTAHARKAESEIKAEIGQPPASAPVVPPVPSPVSEPETVEGKGSFEMRLGTFWLVRVGIVMLLTGLVFFGNYAYQTFIVKMGPEGKVGLLYLAGGLLLGAGSWLQRAKEQAAVRNYGRVLFAGGLAAVYFTTYAAHYVPQLQIIPSALVAGLLLLAWAGFIAWIADRRKSEVLALFGIGLAYYTSAITRVGSFTLYSNLILSLAAIVFLLRNRWAGLSFASLLATYAGYAFWRFSGGELALLGMTPGKELWFGGAFLACYWAMFTAAVFLSDRQRLAGATRALFVTLNNGAFFTLFLLTLLQVRSNGFSTFSLGYGCVLLGLAALCRVWFSQEALTKNAYLTQGLLLVTLGFIARFAGLQLALVLGAESVALFILGSQLRSPILSAAGYVAAALSVPGGIAGLVGHEPNSLWLGVALGGLMAVNATYAHRCAPASDKKPFRSSPGYFSTLALVVWFVATHEHTSTGVFPLALACEAVALTLSVHLLGVREIALLAQGYMLASQGIWLVRVHEMGPVSPWWQHLILIGSSLGMSHWWQWQKKFELGAPVRSVWQAVFALAIMGLLFTWIHPLTDPPAWLALSSLLAIGLTAYGIATRAWFLAAFGQVFLLISVGEFVVQMGNARPEWFFPLAPMAALGLLSFATVRWFRAKPEKGETLLSIAQIYRWVALAMSLWWVRAYTPERHCFWVLELIGFAIFLLAGFWRNWEALCFGGAFTAIGLGWVWFPGSTGSFFGWWVNALALLALPVQQVLARRQPARYEVAEAVHVAALAIGSASILCFLTRHVIDAGGHSYLAAIWGGLAFVLFCSGIVLRERIYRWSGLAVLGLALGRVVLFDVWKQETIYRVLTFTALGLVLLAVGFIYNKYQDTIRKWL